MLNTRELEHRWMRYKIKSYIPHLTIVVSVLIIIILLINFMSDTEENHEKKSHIQKESSSIVQKEVPVHKSIKKEIVQISKKKIIAREEQKHPKQIKVIKKEEEDKVKLSPSLDFMKKMQNSIQPYYKNEVHSIEYQENNTLKKESLATNRTKIQNPQEQKEEASTIEVNRINIHRENTKNDISEVIQRFEKSHNPVLSLFVAKKYYELGKYREAYDYALKTNNIDKNIDKSWIIFSKSLVKMGKKDKAVNTLKTYIRYSHSSSALILLNEIKAGKFK